MTSRRVLLLAIALGAVACASPQSRMQRALDPSMERVLSAEQYLFSVAGISGIPARLTRGDGHVYLSDLAPQMRYLANIGDTARYRALRAFVQERMVRRDPDGLVPARSYRTDAPFQQATPYGYLFLGKALREAWHDLGDTASAQLVTQIKWSGMPPSTTLSTTYQVLARCNEAMDAVTTDRAAGLAVLHDAKAVIGTRKVGAQAAVGTTAAEGELDALSCLTRLSLAVGDHDATVRYLDHLLDDMDPLLKHSGRPALGTAADILLTLHRVRAVGPRYYEPVVTREE